MGKSQKYDADLLVESVVKYAESHSGKIKYTEIAEWASKNVPGLEGVKHYIYRRPEIVTNEKTGKTYERVRPCTEKIEEINARRNTKAVVNSCTLLNSSDPDFFEKLFPSERRTEIAKVRKTVEETLSRNKYLEEKCKSLEESCGSYKKRLEDQEEKIKVLSEKYEEILKTLDRLREASNDRKALECLDSIGIDMKDLKISKFFDSRTIGENEVFNFDDPLEDIVMKGFSWDDED